MILKPGNEIKCDIFQKLKAKLIQKEKKKSKAHEPGNKAITVFVSLLMSTCSGH